MATVDNTVASTTALKVLPSRCSSRGSTAAMASAAAAPQMAVAPPASKPMLHDSRSQRAASTPHNTVLTTAKATMRPVAQPRL